MEDRQPLFQRTFGRHVRPAAPGLLAGGGPAATHFLLLRQKKVSKEKATPPSASRSKAAGNLICGGLAGNRSNSAIASDNRGSSSRQSPATQAHTEGTESKPLVARCATLHAKRRGGSLRSNARQSRASSAVPHAVMRRRVAQGAAGIEAQMFEPAGRVSAPSADPEQHSVPVAQRRADESGSPFFSVVLVFAHFAAQSEQTSRQRTPLASQRKPASLVSVKVPRPPGRDPACHCNQRCKKFCQPCLRQPVRQLVPAHKDPFDADRQKHQPVLRWLPHLA